MSRVLRIGEVAETVGMSVSSIRNRLNPKSKYYDPTFPKPFSLSLTGKGAVGWDEDEVDRWIESRKAKRDLAA
ncbi:helix-turn-helix transcriptional regulator [Serratia fonticola]|uniref:helix-turn-helix transcriptional regulator n=1 Tax=Serratia fonticola TaxID=47917 RepID=UPI001645EAAD|nr:AlpA family phage regulatory protein [Serratia fonticola]MBC3231968.1 AlpA family phage regulatory protein [Serratia fonticola]